MTREDQQVASLPFHLLTRFQTVVTKMKARLNELRDLARGLEPSRVVREAFLSHGKTRRRQEKARGLTLFALKVERCFEVSTRPRDRQERIAREDLLHEH